MKYQLIACLSFRVCSSLQPSPLQVQHTYASHWSKQLRRTKTRVKSSLDTKRTSRPIGWNKTQFSTRRELTYCNPGVQRIQIISPESCQKIHPRNLSWMQPAKSASVSSMNKHKNKALVNGTNLTNLRWNLHKKQFQCAPYWSGSIRWQLRGSWRREHNRKAPGIPQINPSIFYHL